MLKTFNPAQANKVSKNNLCISCLLLLESIQLIWINKIRNNELVLKSFTNDFLNEFT